MSVFHNFPNNPFLLAPLAGVTDLPFRRLCREMGAALVYSEMVSAKALHFRDRKSYELLRTDPSEQPIVFQLFGSEPDIMAEAALLLDDYPNVAIDVNMGCPVHKIVRNGEGSALMKNPELAGRIVEAMVRASSKPITAKIRTGWDADSIIAAEFAKILEAAGAAAVAVHGRTREQYYSGKADWGQIAAVKKAVSIPIIGSGDVFSAGDAVRMLDETGCDAVMIARGALGNPWIFRDALMLQVRGEQRMDERPMGRQTMNGLMSGEVVRDRQVRGEQAEIGAAVPTPAERGAMFLRQLEGVRELKGERMAVLEMRKHVGWYFKGMSGVAAFRAAACRISDINMLANEVKLFCGIDT